MTAALCSSERALCLPLVPHTMGKSALAAGPSCSCAPALPGRLGAWTPARSPQPEKAGLLLREAPQPLLAGLSSARGQRSWPGAEPGDRYLGAEHIVGVGNITRRLVSSNGFGVQMRPQNQFWAAPRLSGATGRGGLYQNPAPQAPVSEQSPGSKRHLALGHTWWSHISGTVPSSPWGP